MRVTHVVGARPNFMKIAPILRALRSRPAFQSRLVHTGQHYDRVLSQLLFEDLGLPEPDSNLGIGSGSHGAQTGALLVSLESELIEHRPDLVLVVGDVNSTLAAALVASKIGIPVAHVEAGLRSNDRRMPEEINRIIADQLSDLLFTHSRSADDNLRREGIQESRIRFVGNVMIDAMDAVRPRVDAAQVASVHGLTPRGYALVTLHRPSNVDDRHRLGEILGALEAIAARMPVLLPAHPRTRQRLKDFSLPDGSIRIIDPVGYVEMLSLQASCAAVLTDSGGIQEETTVLGVPCITLRETTERPVTLEQGTNVLVPSRSREDILRAFEDALARGPSPRRPEGWDGHAAERIVAALEEWGC